MTDEDVTYDFLMDFHNAPLALPMLRVGPEDVVSLDDGYAIGFHLLPVLQGDATYFTGRRHRRRDGKAMKMISTVARNYFTSANAGVHQGIHYTIISAEHLARMACICERLTSVVLAGKPDEVERDDGLITLLRQQDNPNWDDAERAAQSFPDTFTNGNPFGGYMVFQDLVRLIWVHETAHALLGHSDIWSDHVGEHGLPEIDASREKVWETKISDVPWPIALQNFELQADQFAINFITHEILYGWDPAAQMAGPNVDLIKRLAVLAMACATFAVDTELKQNAIGPRDPARATHPSAILRYMTMIHTILEVAHGYEQPELTSWARVASFGAIERLAKAAPVYRGLLSATPMIAKTPLYKQLCDEQDVLMTHVGGMMKELRLAHTYFPTAND